MHTHKIMIGIGKLILLTLILIICFTIVAQVAGMSKLPPGANASPANSGDLLIALLINACLQTAVLSYMILRARWSGWKLIGTLFIAFYGSHTVIAQIESIVYLPRQLPAGMVPRLFVMGALIALMFTPCAVIIWGRMRSAVADAAANLRLIMPPGEWLWKLALITAAYLFLYYFFGYFVAWKNPAVQAYYHGTDPGNFWAQLAAIQQATPWMFPFQALRALFWVALVLPLIRMLRGNSWELALALAGFFSVWSLQLLIPNPYMLVAVAHAHLIETLCANFIFGGLLGWLLSRRHASWKELFKAKAVVSKNRLA